MIPDNVTLIVKAPNQQIEDQNIECQTSWTVRQLKGHLAEVYPNKPSTEEQKIIYSGQLLDDNIILKDVLRTYDCQIAHTMHLVCTPTRRTESQLEANTDGLRRRNVETVERVETPAGPPRPETRQNDQNHNVEMQNYLSSFVNNYGRVPPYPNYNFGEGYLSVPNDPAQLANHMMMMQQAYLQYMQQYANMWQAAGAAGAVGAAGGAGAVPPAAPPAPPPAPPREPEAAPRDWLDHLYVVSRLAILFSLVYLYGSPARFLLVLVLAAAGYLHQIGFFRDLHVNPPVNNRRGEQPQQAAANNHPQPADNLPQPAENHQQLADNRPQPADNRQQPAENRTQTEGTAVQATAADNQQSLLAITWMIFTSFFASLIPDTN